MTLGAYTVVAGKYEAPPSELLAPLLADALGLLPFDASRRAKSVRGILAEGLEREGAERIALALSRGGFPCFVLSGDALPPLYHPRIAREIRLSGDSFQFRPGFSGPWECLAWETLGLLSAGVILEVEGGGFRSTEKKEGGTVGLGQAARLVVDPLGGALSILKKARKRGSLERRPGTPFPHPLADLFFPGKGGQGGWIRLLGRAISYPSVLEGRERGEFFPDFLVLLRELARRAGPRGEGRGITEAARVLMQGGWEDPPLEGPAFFGEEAEFRRYNRWSLACAGGPGT